MCRGVAARQVPRYLMQRHSRSDSGTDNLTKCKSGTQSRKVLLIRSRFLKVELAGHTKRDSEARREDRQLRWFNTPSSSAGSCWACGRWSARNTASPGVASPLAASVSHNLTAKARHRGGLDPQRHRHMGMPLSPRPAACKTCKPSRPRGFLGDARSWLWLIATPHRCCSPVEPEERKPRGRPKPHTVRLLADSNTADTVPTCLIRCWNHAGTITQRVVDGAFALAIRAQGRLDAGIFHG